MAAPFLPATSAPIPAPPAIMAAVRALRPKRERLRRSCPEASGTIVAAKTTKHKSSSTILFIKLSPSKIRSYRMTLLRERYFSLRPLFSKSYSASQALTGEGVLHWYSQLKLSFLPDYGEKVAIYSRIERMHLMLAHRPRSPDSVQLIRQTSIANHGRPKGLTSRRGLSHNPSYDDGHHSSSGL